jgi:hypothetical protein
MRKVMVVGALSAATATTLAVAVAQSGETRSRPKLGAAATAGNDAARVASALELTAAQKAVLAKAQALGRAATRCLLANGATQRPDGGVADATGAATGACQAELAANDAFLESAEFADVLRAAEPKFDVAGRCFRRASGLKAGAIVHPDELTPQLQRRLDEAQAQCFRPDGLPR